MFILDTNVISELMRPQPSPNVVSWIAEQPIEDLFITSISQAEILAGIELMQPEKRRNSLENTARIMFTVTFVDRVLPFHAQAADVYARLFLVRRNMGRPIATLDLQIAAIAKANRATIVTRDVGGFEGCGLKILNPWKS